MKIQSRLFFLLASTCLAGTSFAAAAPNITQNNIKHFLIFAEGGASFSNTTSISHGTDWDSTPQGYSSNLGDSSILGGGLGYIFNPLLTFQVAATYRGDFSYNKYQSSTSVEGDKIRNFNLSNTNVMFDLYLNGAGVSDRLAWKNSWFMLDPFVNVGIGPSFNTVSNFHSTSTVTGKSFSLENSNTNVSFGYEAGGGLNLHIDDSGLVGLGYGYMNAGNFKSNNYLLDNPGNFGTPSGITNSRWVGTLSANEVYLDAGFVFN